MHADSWRRHYRGSYTDDYLDGDIESERLQVWTERLATVADNTRTVVAESAGELAGFVHIALDEDASWGSLVDNLHVRYGHQRLGIGTSLLTSAGAIIAAEASTPRVYLWVQERNVNARAFYEQRGAECAERVVVEPSRMKLRFAKLRLVWPEARFIAHA